MIASLSRGDSICEGFQNNNGRDYGNSSFDTSIAESIHSYF